MNDRPKESDWKRYSKIIPEVRDRYLDRKNEEIVSILHDQARTPTDRFWDAREKSDQVAKALEDCLGYHSRSKMFTSMVLMLRYGMITEKDLAGFSQELQDRLLAFLQI